jgi:hypothetical protein
MMFKRAWLLPLVVSFALLIAFPQEINSIELSIQPSFIDSDNDGFNDSDDAFPNHPDAWSDRDGDGFADQPNTNISDDCPNTYGTSRIQMKGCRDIDGDWIPDVLDDDIDGDGISNELEVASSNALMKYDIFNSSSTPMDSDFDTIPDIVDLDDDNDGWPDLIEEDRGSDIFDEDDTPFTMYGVSSGFFFVPGIGFTNEYHIEGFEVSLSWLFSALSSELIIPIGLIPIYAFIRFFRTKNFRIFDTAISEASLLKDLREIEKEINSAMRDRKLHTHHGIILRNAIERKEDELDDDWFLEYGATRKKTLPEEE